MKAFVLRIEPSSVIYVSAGNGEESVGGGGGYGEQRQQQQSLTAQWNRNGMAGLYDFMRRLGGLRQSESIVQFRALVACHRRV